MVYEYSLDDIQDIKNAMESYEVSSDVGVIINNLVEKLNINIQNKPRILRRDKNRYVNDAQWVKKEPFKATQIEKSIGLDELLDKLRGILNKLTLNNYEQQQENIFNVVSEIINDNTLNKECDVYIKIIDCFYKIVINNRFYSSVYVQLFISISDNFILFDDHRNFFIEKYKELMSDFEYVNPDDDYDKYCIINKMNENRKALLTFIIHAVKYELYSFNILNDILHYYFDKLELTKQDETFVNINEEIIENIFVIFSDGKEVILNEVSRYTFIEKIKDLMSVKISSNKGFSNRMKFKCMDINDLYK